MGELLSALDALAAEDLHALFGPALLDRTAMLLTVVNRAQAELTRTVREADVMNASEHDGLKTMTSWLRGHGHLSPRAAPGWSPPAGPWSTSPRWLPRSPTGS